MLQPLKAFLSAARLRTLPLALSGILTGAAIAEHPQIIIWGQCLLLAILFQIISNFANDLGDGLKGTDKDRIGDPRMISSGAIQPKTMKVVMGMFCFLALVLMFRLLWNSALTMYVFWFFVFLGSASILAALTYTWGRWSYGYWALGDLMVLLFFGFVSVLGTIFLQDHTIQFLQLLPATAIGLLCVAVLNLNNTRDILNDKKNNKTTIANLLGWSAAKWYHLCLILLACLLWNGYLYEKHAGILYYSINGVFLILFYQSKKILEIQEPAHLQPFLKSTALLTFLISLTVLLLKQH